MLNMHDTKVKSGIFLYLILFILPSNSYSQNSSFKSRYNIKMGYSRYISNTLKNHEHVYFNNYKLEFNYKVLRHLEAGIYIGYSKFDVIKINFADTIFYHKNQPALFYGINCNYHLLPFLVKKESKFDLYITGKMGGFYLNSNEGYFPQGNDSEYSIGIGASFYVFKNIGVFSEYTYGKYYFMDNDNLKWGVSIKL